MEHHVGEGIAHGNGSHGAVHHAGAAVPALVGITDLYDGLFILRLAEHVHAADIRADAAGDAGLAVDDRGHITHFFLIDCEDHGHSLC